MTKFEHPFTSLDNFRKQFNSGLFNLLDKQQLGPFILCLANASNDPDLFQQLKLPLKSQYNSLLRKFQAALMNGQQLDVVEEDFLVFLKLHALGFDNVQLTQLRNEGIWLCQFNQLRSFRPKRMTNFAHNGAMFTPFKDSEFNFNKPFMQKECFWSGVYEGVPIDLFYNKYPFADLHGLIVPRREDCLPQLLLQDIHCYIWQLTQKLSLNLPGLALGYNSYGAYASVNHLHFQMFIDPQGLPISHSQWLHNNGDCEYPAKVNVFYDDLESWAFINQLHNDNQVYNLLYMPEKIFVIQRQLQGSIKTPTWSSGFTWYEMSGALLLFNNEDYKQLTVVEIEMLLKSHSV